MKLGTRKTVITPPIGTPLAGYGFRDHGAEAILDDLEVRALWFQEGDDPRQAACLVTADLIGFGPALTTEIRTALTQRIGIPPERVLLTASHTHSGPQTDESMVGCGAIVAGVVATVRERILEAVKTASHDLHPVTLCAGCGRCEGYAINRRLVKDGQVLFVPNPDGVHDDVVIVIACHDAASGAVRAGLFQFTCHPTLMGDYRITADYPGAARRYVEEALGHGAVAAFLPGCFGDVRPNCTVIGGGKFRRGQPDDVAAFGAALGEEVVRVVRGDTQPLSPRLNGQATTLDLPLARHPGREELEQLQKTGTPVEQEWASRLLSKPFSMTRPLTLQRIDLASEARLIAMGGEVCCEYGHFIKGLQQDAFLIPVGYSNGFVAYIPTARIFSEGGYEPDGSCLYFGLPGPLQPDIEGMIHAEIRKIMEAAASLPL